MPFDNTRSFFFRSLLSFGLVGALAACAAENGDAASSDSFDTEATDAAADGGADADAAPDASPDGGPTRTATLDDPAPTVTEYDSQWWGSTTGYPMYLYGAKLTADVDDAAGTIVLHFDDKTDPLDVRKPTVDTPPASIAADGSFSVEVSPPDEYVEQLNLREHFVRRWSFGGTVSGGRVTLTSFSVSETELSATRDDRTGAFGQEYRMYTVTDTATGKPASGALR